MTSSRRTRTGSQAVFKLSRPDPVIYDFSELPNTGLKITVPSKSAWFCHDHWHETALACETLEPLEGHFKITHHFVTSRGSGVITGRAPGFVMPLRPHQAVKWQLDPDAYGGSPAETLVFALKASDNVYAFYRQLCSVNQDAEIYFELTSTPLWLRYTYASWGWVPYLGARVRQWMVNWLLWIQLRMIFWPNDYLEVEGRIPFTMPWWQLPGAQNPPQKWLDKELKSRVIISKMMQRYCSWVGMKMLGMKDRYKEYEVEITPKISDDLRRYCFEAGGVTSS